MICPDQMFVVDIWSDMDCPKFLQAKCHFDEALAGFEGRDRVQVKLRCGVLSEAEAQAVQAETCPADRVAGASFDDELASALPMHVPRFSFNQYFHVSGVQPVQRYARALNGMLILSMAASSETGGSACPLGHGLV